jgi:hypothetical protein
MTSSVSADFVWRPAEQEGASLEKERTDGLANSHAEVEAKPETLMSRGKHEQQRSELFNRLRDRSRPAGSAPNSRAHESTPVGTNSAASGTHNFTLLHPPSVDEVGESRKDGKLDGPSLGATSHDGCLDGHGDVEMSRMPSNAVMELEAKLAASELPDPLLPKRSNRYVCMLGCRGAHALQMCGPRMSAAINHRISFAWF